MRKEKTLSPVFSNLAKAASKQQRPEEASLFNQLAEQMYVEIPKKGDLNTLKKSIVKDIEDHYPAIREAATAVGDRGALRAVTWGEKVTKIHKSLLARYASKGDAILDGNEVFICEACGFIAIAPVVPVRCPICKVVSSRFSLVK